MTAPKSVLDLAREYVSSPGACGNAFYFGQALLALAEERDELVERCAKVADKHCEAAADDNADYEVLGIAQAISDDIRALKSKPQEASASPQLSKSDED